MPSDRDLQFALHCATCGHATTHLMVWDGTAYTDLVCLECRRSATAAPSSPWPRYGEHEQ